MSVRIGRKDWAWEEQNDDALEARIQGTGSKVWISASGKPVAVALVRERLRSSAAATFEALDRLESPPGCSRATNPHGPKNSWPI